MNSTLILTIVLLVVVALVVVNYLNKKHIRYNPSDLQKSTQKILEKQAGKPITKANFLIELKMEGLEGRKFLGKDLDVTTLLTIEE